MAFLDFDEEYERMVQVQALKGDKTKTLGGKTFADIIGYTPGGDKKKGEEQKKTKGEEANDFLDLPDHPVIGNGTPTPEPSTEPSIERQNEMRKILRDLLHLPFNDPQKLNQATYDAYIHAFNRGIWPGDPKFPEPIPDSQPKEPDPVQKQPDTTVYGSNNIPWSQGTSGASGELDDVRRERETWIQNEAQNRLREQGLENEVKAGEDAASLIYVRRNRKRLEDQMDIEPTWWPKGEIGVNAIQWPPLKVLGNDLMGQPILGVDWDVVGDVAKTLDINLRGEAVTEVSIAKLSQQELIAADPSLQANSWDMPIPGVKASLPVMRSSDGSIQAIDIPSLDKQIDRAIISGDISRAKTLIGIRDAPSSQEKLGLAMEIARSPADVYQLSRMAGGDKMERFGELAPFLQQAAMNVFKEDPFSGLTPEGGGEQRASIKGGAGTPKATSQLGNPVNDGTSETMKSMYAQLEESPQYTKGMPDPVLGRTSATQPGRPKTDVGGAFIQEAPADLVQQRGSYAALEDFYEDEPYGRAGSVGANVPTSPAAPVDTSAQRRLFDQMIAEGMTAAQAYRYSKDASNEISSAQTPIRMTGDDRSMGGDPDMEAFRRANSGMPSPSYPTGVGIGANSNEQSINSLLASRGYFIGGQSSGSPIQKSSPTQAQNIFSLSADAGGMPGRVQDTLVEGSHTPPSQSLLSQVGLRPPSMQSYQNWLPQELDVAKRELEMRGIDPSRLWDEVQTGTPGGRGTRTYWKDSFLD